MSFLTKDRHITVRPFAKVPALGDLPEIRHALRTVVSSSSRHRADGSVDLAEGCLLTKTVKYTHQLAHWVNAIRSGDPKEVVSEVPTRTLVRPTESLLKEYMIIKELCIIPYRGFMLNDSSNLTFCKSSGFVFWNSV